MSIASKLELLQQDITNARTAITTKGGTVTQGGGSSQLATDIATIPSGGSLKTLSTITENGKYCSQNVVGVIYDGTYFTKTDVTTTSIDRYAFLYETTFKTSSDINSEQWIFGVACNTANEYLGLKIANGRLYCHSNYDMTGLGLVSTPIEANTTYTVLFDRNTSLQTTQREWVVNGTRIATIQNRYRGYVANTNLYLGSNPQIEGNYFKGTLNAFELWINADGDYSRSNTKIRVGFDNYFIVNQITSVKFAVNEVETGSLGYDGFSSPIEVSVPVPSGYMKYGAVGGSFLGDVNASGVLEFPTFETDLVFNGIKGIPNMGFYYKFYRCNGIKSVSFPDLEQLASSSMNYSFYNVSGSGSIKTLSMPKLKSAQSSAMSYAFQYQDLSEAELNLPQLTSVANQSFNYTFYNTKLKGFYADALQAITGTSAFSYAFYNNSNNDFEFHFNNLQSIKANSVFNYAFQNSNVFKNKIAHPFPALKSIDGNTVFGYAFSNTYIRRFVFDSLETIGTITSNSNNAFAGAFQRCYWPFEAEHSNDYDRIGVFFPALKTIGYNNTSNRQHFANICSSPAGNRPTIHCYELTNIITGNTSTTQGHFQTSGAKRVYLPKLNSMTNGTSLFYSDTTLEEIHFGIENQATIQAMSGYANKFGATNATIYFDMPNHLTVDGVVYDRDGAKCDLDNWYFAWTNGGNTIYTTNFKDPAVGDTVYTKSGDTYVSSGTIGAIA